MFHSSVQGATREHIQNSWKDALSLLKLEDLPVVETTGDMPSEVVKKLFMQLIPTVQCKLKSFSYEDRKIYLDILYEVLTCAQALKQVTKQMHFKGDFEIFAYFMQAALTAADEHISMPDLNSLWSKKITYPDKRYEVLVIVLLGAIKFQYLHAHTLEWSLSDIRQQLDQLERLSRLCLNPSAPMTTLQCFIYTWLEELGRFLRNLLGLQVKVNDMEYLQSIDLTMKLMCRFNHLEPQELHGLQKNLLDTCHEAMKICQIKFAFNKANPAITTVMVFEKLSFFQWAVNARISLLKKDLQYIKLFGQYSAHALLLNFNSDSLCSDYLKAYQIFSQQLIQLSIAAFNCRMVYEKQWRGDAHYLELLNHFDKKLLRLNEGITAAKQQWRAEVIQISQKNPYFIQFNNALTILENIEAKVQWLDWVHHTAYDYYTTEQCLEYEMQQRRKNKEIALPSSCFYHLEQCITQSDYVILKGVSSSLQTIKQAYLAWHPDKSNDLNDTQDQALRKYCTQQLESYKTKVQHWQHIWKKSQWHGLSLDEQTVNEDAEDNLSLAEDITQIEAPKLPLQLSMIALHWDYLTWAKEQQDLSKKTAPVVYAHKIIVAHDPICKKVIYDQKTIYYNYLQQQREAQVQIAQACQSEASIQRDFENTIQREAAERKEKEDAQRQLEVEQQEKQKAQQQHEELLKHKQELEAQVAAAQTTPTVASSSMFKSVPTRAIHSKKRNLHSNK